MALSKSVKGSGHYSSLSDMGDGYDFKRTNGSIMRVPSFAKGGRYKGVHRTECGERSDSCDFLLENGMITNSLAPYRYSIPETEMKKVYELAEFYKTKNPL